MGSNGDTGLKEVFTVLNKNKFFITGFTLVVVVATVIYSVFIIGDNRSFEASADMNDFLEDFEAIEFPLNISNVVSTVRGEIIDKVFYEHGFSEQGYKLETLRNDVVIDEEDNVIDFRLVSSDKEMAVDFVNKLVDETILYVMDMRFNVIESEMLKLEQAEGFYREEFKRNILSEEFRDIIDELQREITVNDDALIYLRMLQLADKDLIWERLMEIRRDLINLQVEKDKLLVTQEEISFDYYVSYAYLPGEQVMGVGLYAAASGLTALFFSIMVSFLMYFGFARGNK